MSQMTMRTGVVVPVHHGAVTMKGRLRHELIIEPAHRSAIAE
jgi:hypothetical protein